MHLKNLCLDQLLQHFLMQLMYLVLLYLRLQHIVLHLDHLILHAKHLQHFANLEFPQIQSQDKGFDGSLVPNLA